MRTQYEKNSINIAGATYRMSRRKMRLKRELIAFFALLGIVCAVLYLIISAM